MPFVEVMHDGRRRTIAREIIDEAPIALEFNGVSYAVMMATPTDLEDFVVGFALCEGIASCAGNMREISVAEVEQGWIVRASVEGLGVDALSERIRTRVAESSCGLCGIENLEAVSRPLPMVAPHLPIAAEDIFVGLMQMRDGQALGRATGAAHAAAWARRDGCVTILREDVGRHNAMDKLIGGAARTGCTIADGFVVSSARCSYEIVEKAVRAGASTLVTISLPTTMAVERARAARLSLWVLARNDSILCAHDASGTRR